MITFTIPRMKLVNISNVRENRYDRARRTKAQRESAKWHTYRELVGGPEMRAPYECTIVRIGPTKMDRSNLFCAAKAVEDGICDALAVNDGDEERWTLTCTQEKSPKGAVGAERYAVRVEIRMRAP